MIPMVDLKKQYTSLKETLDERILQWLASANFILGPEGKLFEKEITDYLGAKYAFGLASGTDALMLALRIAGIQAGDEVITTPFTFVASASAICMTGATPAFVDIDPKTFNIDPEEIEKAITPKTRALIPVHLFGHAADMTQITALAKKYNLKIIEDCAQSIGSTWENKMTGTFGDFGCFSFYPSKNLGCYGDGGLICTNNADFAEKILMLRNHGSQVRYHHEVLGYNSRLDEIQAIILRTKLPFLNTYNDQRRHVAAMYHHYLKNLDITLPSEHPATKHVYHQYTILSKHRDAISEKLTQNKIANAIFYPIPLHQQKLFNNHYAHLSFPNTESITQQCLSLPLFPEMTEDQVKQVAKLIQKAIDAT
ncbi:MAG: erythromycin biosynthesis sensory transduction protein eryC1 [Gammaproteobacteria bacterium RIFCSPLOWO2_12_FULL_38_14]|nr:MAG: erythromycin biosynthesis sensory transduction protein eryC1 [Gammaproteobacteria bacterium RIFCSPLOWO2_12_FULL_38_14]